MKKLIGVMPLWDDEKNSIWMLPGYLDGLKAAGLDSFIFPLTEDIEEITRLALFCDGILLTGGHDVNPALYHEVPVNQSVVWNTSRDAMELTVIKLALEKNMPVLGICRGIQILNVFLGGTLYQDLPALHHSGIKHHMYAPYNRPCHDVTLVRNTPLSDLIRKDHITVNSIHHQAIRERAPLLCPMALSPDGLIEAVYMPSRKFVWGIQWHPEYWFRENPDCMKIFRCFAENL